MTGIQTSPGLRRVVVVYGSPRFDGNTALLAKMLLDELHALGAVEVRHIRASRLKARPCLACGGCDETGRCVLDDEMAMVYDAVRWADLLVVAVPVFFASVTAQLKAVIDRFQCAWVAKYRLGQPWIDPAGGKRAMLLAVGGMHIPRHLRQTREVVRSWLAVINYDLAGDISIPGVDAKGDVLEVPDIADQVQRAAQLLWTGSPSESSPLEREAAQKSVDEVGRLP